MDFREIAARRYTTKVFDPTRRIEPALMEQLETLLHLAPSSTNSQPWHFFVAHSEEGRQRVAKATSGFYQFNQAKVTDASHVVVLCTRTGIDEQHLLSLLDAESNAGRLPDEAARAKQNTLRTYFVDVHRYDIKDVQHWMEKQVYIALGTLLLAAGALGIDACPIEGFDQRILDQELGLREKGLTSTVIVSLGYRSKEDFNARLPKARLPKEQVLTRL